MNDNGDTQDRLTKLAEQLGIALADYWQWVGEFGPDVVTAGVEAFDGNTLPFMGEG